MDAELPIQYRKLPGRGTRFLTGGSTTLWAGPDHLLLVENTRFSEDYKRFYFKDIKAIVVRRTRRWEITNKVAGAISLLAILLPVVAYPGRTNVAGGFIALGIFLGIVGSGALLIFLLNLIGGPTCICHLRTSVQQEEISSLKRLRTARKALKKIRPLVEGVQGTLGEEGLERVAETIAGYENLPVSKVLTAFGSGIASPPPVPPENASGGWQGWLVAALFLNTAAGAVLHFVHNDATFLFLWVSVLALGAAIIAGLMRSGAYSRSLAWLRTGIWGAYMLTLAGYTYVANIQFALQHPGVMRTSYTAVHESFFSVVLGAAVVSAVWGILEAGAIVDSRARNARGIPVEPAEPGSN